MKSVNLTLNRRLETALALSLLEATGVAKVERTIHSYKMKAIAYPLKGTIPVHNS
ncbi:hypothetical protein GS682_24050 [Nostoc sp. B(2019)]|nr:hypothetical protein [Nostoc sp. B(2019)]